MVTRARFASAAAAVMKHCAVFATALSIACDGRPTSPTDEIHEVPPLPATTSAFSSGRTWQLLGGKGVRGSWDSVSAEALQVRCMALYQGDLVVGLGDSDEFPELGQVWRFDGRRWTMIGGKGVNASWSKRMVGSLVADGNKLYAGLGSNPGDAEVWEFDGSTWRQIGGDGIAGSWDDAHDLVWTMTMFRSQLYAGLFTEKSGEQRPVLYRYDGATWEYLAGDENPVTSPRGGWMKNDGIMMVYRLNPGAGEAYLYIGLAGRDTNNVGAPRPGPAQVWRFDGTSFEKIGGNGMNGSWNYDRSFFLEDVREFGLTLLVSLQLYWESPSRSAIWRWNGTSWSPFASRPDAWLDIQNFNVMHTYNGRLYVGAGLPTGNPASVWELQPDHMTWQQVGGAGLFGSTWHREITPTTTQWVYPLMTYRGHLVLGLASAETPGGAQVWIY